jgi:hypothetical protein
MAYRGQGAVAYFAVHRKTQGMSGPGTSRQRLMLGVLCFSGFANEFYTFDGELLALNITGVNSPAAVPGPIAGAGLPGMVLGFLGVGEIVEQARTLLLSQPPEGG